MTYIVSEYQSQIDLGIHLFMLFESPLV